MGALPPGRAVRRREAGVKGAVSGEPFLAANAQAAGLPRVVLVPAMLIAFTNMHEKGVTYVYAG